MRICALGRNGQHRDRHHEIDGDQLHIGEPGRLAVDDQDRRDERRSIRSLGQSFVDLYQYKNDYPW